MEQCVQVGPRYAEGFYGILAPALFHKMHGIAGICPGQPKDLPRPGGFAGKLNCL